MNEPWWRTAAAIIPGILALSVVFLGGIAIASKISDKQGHTVRYTFTRKGRVVSVKGDTKLVKLPARTITRNGQLITIPAKTIAITDTQTLPGATNVVTRNGTVTITHKGGTTTLPGTTITQTTPGTTITETIPVPTTITVTETGPTTTITSTITVGATT
jgi:hypothetical protein